uniref:Uncharacterized protein n=1 Tax=Lepeophtheirus salmonis TaxID=72036 RepID=A0A0K2SXW5_LEPSM
MTYLFEQIGKEWLQMCEIMSRIEKGRRSQSTVVAFFDPSLIMF